MTIAITASTGKIGTAVLAAAKAEGLPVRGLSRRTEPRFDFDDPATHPAAFAGVETLLLVSPPSERQAELDGAVYAAARTAGVRHVVKISGEGADTGATRFTAQHLASEEKLRASGVAWTVVRPTFFMENLLGLAPAIAAGTYPAPTADARMAQVAVADIAAVLLAIARDPARHREALYTPTGAHAATGEEIAAALAAARGRPVRYVNVPEEAFRENLARVGLDAWTAGGLVEAYRKVRAGGAMRITADVANLTGKAPLTLEAWARTRAF